MVADLKSITDALRAMKPAPRDSHVSKIRSRDKAVTRARDDAVVWSGGLTLMIALFSLGNFGRLG